MKRKEFEDELKYLYSLAIKVNNPGLALAILNQARDIGVENIRPKQGQVKHEIRRTTSKYDNDAETDI